MIHCIGDSHSAVFSGEDKMQPIWPEPASNLLPYFKSYRIGPCTAYQLDSKRSVISNILDNNLNHNDKVMFCFGEVDARAHLIKQADIQKRDIKDIVLECTNRYIDSVLYYKRYNVELLLWGVIASWNESKPYTGGPSFGTNIVRNRITKMFNDNLKNNGNGIKFISIFEEMLNNDYTTNVEFLDEWEGSHMHLSQKTMPLIIEKFKKENSI
jgi:hypothetical protein